MVLEVKWPIYTALYIFFTGMSAGSFVLSTLGNVFGMKKYKPLSRLGAVVATILLMLAPLFLILDLEQPMKFYTTLYYTNPWSVMSWGVYLLTLYPVNCIIYVWFMYRADFARLIKRHSGSTIKKGVYYALALGQTDLSEKALQRDAKMTKTFGIIGVPLALMVHGYTGFILAVVVAGVLWHTSLMPPLFLTSAIISGIALFIILMAIYGKYFSRSRKIDTKTTRDLALLMAYAMIVDLTLFLCEFIVLWNSGEGEKEAVWLLTQGPLMYTFIGVELFLGAILPVLIVFYPRTGKTLAGQITASLLIMIGILAMRFNIIVGGQFIPLSGGNLIEYHVTMEELLSSLMVGFIGAGLMFAAFKVLPIEPLKVPRPVRAAKTLPVKVERRSKKAVKPTVYTRLGLTRRDFIRAFSIAGGGLAVMAMGMDKIGGLFKGFGPGAASAFSTTKTKDQRYAMVIDLRRCIGCHSCTQACKETYNLPEGHFRSWVTKIRKTDGVNEKHMFLPRLCNHCDNPACVTVCPIKATYKTKSGIVLQRYDRCIGCKYCTMACPYNMRFVHPTLKVVDKCTFCHHRVKNGLNPACVEACPAGARIFGDLNNPYGEVSKLITTQPTTTLKPELGTKPMVYYIGADQDLLSAGLRKEH